MCPLQGVPLFHQVCVKEYPPGIPHESCSQQPPVSFHQFVPRQMALALAALVSSANVVLDSLSPHPLCICCHSCHLSFRC